MNNSICCSWLKSICCSWLQYLLSFVSSCGSSGCHSSGSSLQYRLCRSWLHQYRLCRSWLHQSPVSVAPVSSFGFVVRVSSICCLVAPVSPPVSVVSPTCGSSIYCGCLHYHYLSLVAPVAPVSVACGSCCSCGFNRQPSSVLVIFL